MTELDDQDAKSLIFDAGDDSDIAYAIFPELAQTRAAQGLANAARVVQGRHPIAQERQDASGMLRVELVEIFLSEG